MTLQPGFRSLALDPPPPMFWRFAMLFGSAKLHIYNVLIQESLSFVS
jgi:hypothetical protein